jgi:shikimate kinase
MKNIALVGFMGTGKSVAAKRVARRLNMKYINTDDTIESREGKSIREIFAQDGEKRFREIEADVVKEASSADGVVIATGGGVVLSAANMDNLRKNGVVICLNARAEDIFERTKSYAHRPLLNVPDPLGKIKELMKAREPYYKKADHQIETTGMDVDQIVDAVITIAGK